MVLQKQRQGMGAPLSKRQLRVPVRNVLRPEMKDLSTWHLYLPNQPSSKKLCLYLTPLHFPLSIVIVPLEVNNGRGWELHSVRGS